MTRTEDIYKQKTDYRAIFFHFLKYKWLFLLMMLIAFVAAIFYNKYSSPVYENAASLIIKKKDTYSFLQSEEFLKGYGLLYDKEQVQDELGIISSYTLCNQAVKNLNLEIGYFSQKSFLPGLSPNSGLFELKEELYKNTPVKVQLNKRHLQIVDLPFFIEIISDSSYEISVEGENIRLFDYFNSEEAGIVNNIRIKGKFKFGEQVTTNYFSFRVFHNPEYFGDYVDSKIYFAFFNTNYITLQYQSMLAVSSNDLNQSLFGVSMRGNHAEKITDILNELTTVYIENNLNNKNRILDNTISFINGQISEISDTLTSTEDVLEEYQTRYKITDLSFQGEKIYEKLKDLENDRAELAVKLKYYDYIINYFKNNESVSDLVAPSAMNVDDKLLNNLISELIQLSIQRSFYLKSPKNLYLKEIELNIQDLKNTIRENIIYNKRQTEIQSREINDRISSYYGEIAALPRTERGLLGIQRKFELTDAIYTFLLQKRAEAQIARASNTPDVEIVDPARRITAYAVFPKKRMNIGIAVLIGFLIPFLFILIKDFMNNRISTKNELKRFADLPLTGNIAFNGKRFHNVIANYPDAVISEQFRSLRTSVQFHLNEEVNKAIVITSSVKNEGKTFLAQNLASALSLTGKSTLLLDLDFRNPNLHNEFGLSNKTGATNFIEENRPIQDIIQKTSIKNLDMICSGKTTRNPAELLNAENCARLIDQCKQLYDYVVIDSTALERVTDTFLILKHSDFTILTTRFNFTAKETLQAVHEKLSDNGFLNVHLVLNADKSTSKTFDLGFKSTIGRDKAKMSAAVPAWVWVIPAFLVVIIAAYFVFSKLPGKQDTPEKIVPDSSLKQKNILDTAPAEKKEESLQPEEKDLNKDTAFQEKIPEASEQARTDNTTEPSNETGLRHHIVAGSFQDRESAEKFRKSLVKEGYDAKIVGKRNDMFTVSFGSFDNKQDAMELVSLLAAKNKSGWYLFY